MEVVVNLPLVYHNTEIHQYILTSQYQMEAPDFDSKKYIKLKKDNPQGDAYLKGLLEGTCSLNHPGAPTCK